MRGLKTLVAATALGAVTFAGRADAATVQQYLEGPYLNRTIWSEVTGSGNLALLFDLTDVAIGATLSAADVTGLSWTGAFDIVGVYLAAPEAPGAWAAGAVPFTRLTTVTVAQVTTGTTLSRALWIEFDVTAADLGWGSQSWGLASLGGKAVKFDAGTMFKSSYATWETPALVPIPLPSAGWLMLTALGGLSLVARRRKRA